MQKILGSFPPDPQSQGGLCQRLCQITNAEIPWRSGLTKGPPESDVTPELCPKGATSVLRGEQNTSDHKLPRRVIFVLFYFAFCSSTFLLSTKAMFFFLIRWSPSSEESLSAAYCCGLKLPELNCGSLDVDFPPLNTDFIFSNCLMTVQHHGQSPTLLELSSVLSLLFS